MGKAYTRAAKRRAKKSTLPEIEEIPKRQPNGKRRQRQRGVTEPQKPALGARCRIFGIPDTKWNRRRMSGPHMGAQIGMVMEHRITGKRSREHINRLWSCLCNFAASYAIYQMRYVGITERPACLSIMCAREFNILVEMHKADTRSEDEKSRAAVNNWMRWQGYLGQMERQDVAFVHDARLERVVLWRDTQPTDRGISALGALRILADVVDA